MQSPELRGRLCNVAWKSIEPEPGVYTWDALDTVLYRTGADSLPLIFMVYTKEDAPDWLFTTGNVPRVVERNEVGDSVGYAPYYLDENYRNYFKNMITRVRLHMDSLPWNVREWIIGVQACFGSTGDAISYKGFVDPQYQLSSQQFNTLFKEFSLAYYNAYITTDPKISVLSNPDNKGEAQCNWLEENCPGGWIKTGSLGKSYQLNDELDKSMWLHDMLNTPREDGDFLRARCEIGGDGLRSGYWNICKYKNVFAVLASCVYWGVDWSNQNYDMIDDSYNDPAYFFFNRYAGQKTPDKSTNAMSYLKDALDASDTDRFPESIYGKAKRKNQLRYFAILDSFISYGAKEDDILAASQGEMGNRIATGLNDVGWRILPGNYERYMRQLMPNETSVGYWNVQSSDSATTIYGRFARGFDLAQNKDGLYFMMDSAFMSNAPLNAQYPITLDIVYLDKGNGAWKLFYDAMDSTDKEALSIQCNNTGNWKTASVTLYDAYFGQRASRQSDFYIKNNGNENVIFQLVEIARPDSLQSNIGIHTSPLTSFDTVCINSNAIKPLAINGDFMNNTPVQIGPAPGYLFSFSDSAFQDSLIISDYGNRFSKQVNVKLITSDTGTFYTFLPITSSFQDSIMLQISGTVVNSFADIQANVMNVTCYNAKNGNISLLLDDSINTYQYSWSEPNIKFSSNNKNIDSLLPGNYHLDVFAAGACKSSADFVITQPDLLQVSINADTMICKNGLANVTVTATGGTLPYIGTGVIPSSPGNRNFTVIDSNGCTVNKTIPITNGTMVVPAKPVQIFSAAADSTGLCNGGDYNFYIDTVSNATNYQWSLPENCYIISASTDSSAIIMHAPESFSGGTLSVVSANICGVSTGTLMKTLTSLPAPPSMINGPVNVMPSQQDINYSLTETQGLTYNWAFPPQVLINSGQGSSLVNVNWGVVSGNIYVNAQNNCGQSANTVLQVSTIGGLFTLSDTILSNFDTTCVGGLSTAKSFGMSASGIYGAPVTIGPAAGFKFSPSLNGTYTDSLVYSNYGNNLNKSVFVKFSPITENTNEAFVPVSSNDFQTAYIHVTGKGILSSPQISAEVIPVNCFGEKNGSIDVQTNDGNGPFTFSWKSSSPPFSSNESYISGLKAADYTVTINSYGGCSASSTFTVTQPDILKTVISADEMYCKNSTTNVYVDGSGGNLPYTGTGTFTKGPGSSLYSISDAKGCTAQQYFNVQNGSVVAPVRPNVINAEDAINKGLCFPTQAVLSIESIPNASHYSWTLPNGLTMIHANTDSSEITILPKSGFSTGTVSVQSVNACGISMGTIKTLQSAPSKPPYINGPVNIDPSFDELEYSTEYVEGITYAWSVPVKSTIINGQNTNQIHVDWGTKPGNVSVKKLNACAQSPTTYLYVNLKPGFQNGFSNTSIPANEQMLKENESPVKVSLYPNPARDFTVLQFYMKSSKSYTVQLLGMDGQVLQNLKGIGETGNNQLRINLANYANGLYQLIYFNEKGIKSVMKFTKEK